MSGLLAEGKHDALSAAIERLGELPVLDRTVQLVLARSRDPECSTGELVSAFETDAAFAANLLRFANSGYAARPIRVHTIRQAVMLAGREQIGRLALEAATYRFLERAPGTGRVSAGLMQVHASAVASVSLELARRSGAVADVAHLAGLLHDLGKVVLPLAFEPGELDAIASRAPGGPDRVALERERLGCDHALAGALLADASRIDPPVVAAILAHHDAEHEPSLETACVQLANTVIGMLMGIDPDPVLLDQAMSVLGVRAEDLDSLVGYAGELGSNPTALTPTDGLLAARVAQLEQQANTDELTGLANRRHWKELAGEQLNSSGGALMMCDIDHFKQVNDSNGHDTGDLVLCEVARILAHHGLAGRLGGDELVLFAATPDRTAAAALARSILSEVASTFSHGAIRGWSAGVSIGVAVAAPGHTNISLLLAAADNALYDAKRTGRGRFTFAEQPAGVPLDMPFTEGRSAAL